MGCERVGRGVTGMGCGLTLQQLQSLRSTHSLWPSLVLRRGCGSVENSHHPPCASLAPLIPTPPAFPQPPDSLWGPHLRYLFSSGRFPFPSSSAAFPALPLTFPSSLAFWLGAVSRQRGWSQRTGPVVQGAGKTELLSMEKSLGRRALTGRADGRTDRRTDGQKPARGGSSQCPPHPQLPAWEFGPH